MKDPDGRWGGGRSAGADARPRDGPLGSGTGRTSRAFLAVALAAPILIPIVVFTAVAVTSGMGVDGSVRALVEQSTGRRQNPLVTGALGLFPVALLWAGLGLARRLGPDRAAWAAAAWGGLAAILLVLVWANVQFWPLFLPDRVYPGFPHGLELVIGPIFFAPVAMVVGALVVVLALGRRR